MQVVDTHSRMVHHPKIQFLCGILMTNTNGQTFWRKGISSGVDIRTRPHLSESIRVCPPLLEHIQPFRLRPKRINPLIFPRLSKPIKKNHVSYRMCFVYASNLKGVFVPSFGRLKCFEWSRSKETTAERIHLIVHDSFVRSRVLIGYYKQKYAPKSIQSIMYKFIPN